MRDRTFRAFVVFNPWQHPVYGTTSYLAQQARSRCEEIFSRRDTPAIWSDLLKRGYRVRKITIKALTP